MKRLLNLKEWLTITDAAKHLSILFNEDINIADVLRLGLDGHLTLSVNFVNHAKGRMGRIVPIDEAKMRIMTSLSSSTFPAIIAENILSSELDSLPEEISNGLNSGDLVLSVMGDVINEHEVIQYEDGLQTLTDVWDIPMLGGEKLDIEHMYQQLTGGPAITLTCLDGAFVVSPEGAIANIQESFDKNEFEAGSKAQLDKIKQYIDDNNLSEDKVKSLLNRHKKDREQFLEKQKSRPTTETYYPSGGLPDDSVLVVRTKALREFEQLISDDSATSGKELKPNERNSLLTIIAALCHKTDIDFTARGTASRIAKFTEVIGAPVSDDTVRRALVKIPDALESRMR